MAEPGDPRANSIKVAGGMFVGGVLITLMALAGREGSKRGRLVGAGVAFAAAAYYWWKARRSR